MIPIKLGVHIDVADYMRSRELYCFRYCLLFVNYIYKSNGGCGVRRGYRLRPLDLFG